MAVTEQEAKDSAKYIQDRTILLFEQNGDLFKPKGSGVTMEFLDLYFIITASHVIIDDKPLYFYLPGFGIQKIEEIYREAIDYNLEGNYNQDVGYIILSIKSALSISLTHTFKHPKSSLMIHDMVHDTIPYQLYQIAGYPEKFNRQIKLDEELDHIYPATLTSAPIKNPNKVFKYYKLNPISHYILQGKGVGDTMKEENRFQKAPPWNGMSGGGIWLMGFYEGEVLPILIGIFTEIRTGKYYSYIGCKINIILKRIITIEQAGVFGTSTNLSKP